MQPILHIFRFRQQPVRVLIEDGHMWFVARDICGQIGLDQVSRAVSRLDADERGLKKIPHPQNPLKNIIANVVTLPGLYQLILTGTKAESRTFRRWLTHEVVPALQQTGEYRMNPATRQETTIAPPPRLFSRRDLLNMANEAEAECEQLRGQVAELTPKAEFYDRVANSPSTFSLGETAKMLKLRGVGRNTLARFLRRLGILMSDNVALQRYIDRGYFEVVQRDFTGADGIVRAKSVTRVREKGVDYIRRLIDNRLRDMTGQDELEMLRATGTEELIGDGELILIQCHAYIAPQSQAAETKDSGKGGESDEDLY